MGEGFDPNMLDNLVGVTQDVHRLINSEWSEFRKNYKTPTMDEILGFVAQIEEKYGKNFIR